MEEPNLPLSQRHHAIDGSSSPGSYIGRYGDVISIEREGIANLGKGDRLHERTHRLRVCRDELLVGRYLLHPVHDSGLGGHDELGGRTFGDLTDHALGRGDVQSFGADVAHTHAVDELTRAATLGVNQHLCLGIFGTRLVQHVRPNALVDVTLTHPDLDLPLRPHPADVAAEEEIGQEENPFVFRDSVDDIEHVAAGAAVVQLGFDLCRGVDIPNGDVPRELRLPTPN